MKRRESRNNTNHVKHRWGRYGFGIRGQLVLWLTIFVAIVLLIVWVFQVVLLDYFYEQTKLAELESVRSGIDQGIAEGNLDIKCSDLASQFDVCIAIYSIIDGEIHERILSKEVSPTCIIHYADSEALNSYYTKALESGGTFTQKYRLAPADKESSDIEEGGKKKPHPGHKNEAQFQLLQDDIVIAVSVKAFTDQLGNEYAAFINLRFTPVSAVQQTRSVQFWYIAAVVISASIIFALIFSSKIARPLERMTVAAEHMADGSNTSEFRVEGYRETRRLAETLNYAVEEISQVEKLQRELMANVSHDLRTPLTLISGYAEMMRDIPGENTPENSQIIVDESRRLTTLVNDMLDFSKYSSGFETPHISHFDLTESVREAINRYSELVRLNGYLIEFEAPENVIVLADERMILQVLYNLINNAVNYTGTDKRVVIKQSVSNNKFVRISISDTGNGISKDDITKIWNRYYKVDKSHKRAITGSGLGLSIVSKLLQLHSASYGVESAECQGSTFWFELKIAEIK